jgi:uncharacterized protein YneF (UPF0154 family)
MIAYTFGVMDYVVGGIHLALLVGLMLGGIYLIYKSIKKMDI